MATEIIIDSNIITISSKLISIALGLVTMFLLFEIKERVIDRLKPVFIYLIIAIITMISLRTFGIMNELGLLVSTFYDSATIIFSIFLLLGILSFYKFVVGITNQIERKIYEPKEIREEKPQTSMIHANRLREVEEKIRKVENKIKEGSMKAGEAEKTSKKFKLQLASLDEAYEKGYISQQAYERGKERIKQVSEQLKKKHL
jgi:hypothetical protein